MPHTFTLHGDTRTDLYTWLRQKSDPAVLEYLGAENAYTAQMMEPTQALQTKLYDELLGRIKQTDSSVPYRRGAYEYYARTQAGRQYATYCRRQVTSTTATKSNETVLLDLNTLCGDRAFIALGDFAVSDDGNLLAYTLDMTGDRQYLLYVQDLRNGELVGTPVECVAGVVWTKDDRTLVYVTQDVLTHRADRIWRHTIATGARLQIFEEGDDIYDLSLERTRDGEYIIVTSTAKDTTECRYLRAEGPVAEPAVFAPRRDGIRYSLDVRAHLFYVRSNEGAPNFRLFTTPVASPECALWTLIVPQRDGATIEGFELFEKFAVVVGRRDGLASIDLLDLQTYALTPLRFDAVDYLVDLGENHDYAASTLRFTFESMITPRSVYELDIASGTRVLLKETDIPGYDPDAYVIGRTTVTAHDGTPIPVSFVHRKDLAHAGPAPMLLHAYGAYGISIDSHFSSARIALVDRGVTFAVAHIRGGGEYGEAWRIAGNMLQKRTTFSDFIDVAQGLIAAGYTSVGRLAIEGASAGGLLMGAATNMRPDLFAAVVAKVPFVDVLTTMLDATLPLTTGEYREWGDPGDAEAYAYMRSYSPLDNVRAQPYPALLIEVGLNDSQVPYWEGAKFAAKLRSHSTSGKPILLKTNMHAGHGGSSGRYDKLREIAFEYAFVLRHLGIAG